MDRSRVVLVTGAAGGIGSAIARALVNAGHSVAAIDRDAEGLKRLAISERIHPIMADLAGEAPCREVVAAAIARPAFFAASAPASLPSQFAAMMR